MTDCEMDVKLEGSSDEKVTVLPLMDGARGISKQEQHWLQSFLSMEENINVKHRIGN